MLVPAPPPTFRSQRPYRARRASVSSECLSPAMLHRNMEDKLGKNELNKQGVVGTDFEVKKIPKSEEDVLRITRGIEQSFIFRDMSKEGRTMVVEAMEKMKVEVTGEEIISQGQQGDYFYVLDEGECEVLIDGQKVLEYKSYRQKGSEYNKDKVCSFGEVAMMYNCPLAATVRSITPCVLWKLDRLTIGHILSFSDFAEEPNNRSLSEKV